MMSTDVLRQRWEVRICKDAEVDTLSKKLSVSPLTAQLLINRNLGEEKLAHDFLHAGLQELPDPFLLSDMDVAVNRILTAMKSGEKIVVYGDYDVDGTVGTSLLLLFFKELGTPVSFYIPHRIHEGYSLNKPAIDALKAQGVTLIITVDNGIAAYQEISYAKSVGVDVIVTDHHQLPEKLPEATAVINPLRPDAAYPGVDICGAGVAFQLMMALRRKLEEKKISLTKYVDLVAIATVADVVNLKGVNRILVKRGLEQMGHTVWPGLKCLIQVAGMTGEAQAFHLGYYLGPRLNACGRLYDASVGVKLLTSQSEVEAMPLALELDRANNERRDVEKEMVCQALAKANEEAYGKMSFVLYDESWHPGVVGIVASRLVDKKRRPVILLGKDGNLLKGSGRSYGGLNLVAALKECESVLIRYGGHAAAAGISLSPDRLDDFRKMFEQAVSRSLDPKNCDPILHLDAELSLADISRKLHEELKQLEPHGQGNPEPLFYMKGIAAQYVKVVGENHLKFSAQSGSQQISAIAFGQARNAPLLEGPFDLACTLKMDSYQGNKKLVLHVKEIRSSNS